MATKTASGVRLKITVDLPWSAAAHMGTGIYSETMVRALAQAAPDSDLILFVPTDAPRSINLANVSYHVPAPMVLRDDGFRQIALPAFLEQTETDCLFAPATMLPMIKICPAVMTVHDLTFVEHPEYYGQNLLDYLDQTFEPSLHAADHIIAISEKTKLALLKHFTIAEKNVTVIRQPVQQAFHDQLDNSTVQNILTTLGIDCPFFFHISNLAPHKNTSFAIEAFAKFLQFNPTANHQLIFAGGGVAPNKPYDVLELARMHDIPSRVRYIDRVNNDQLRALYQGCTAFLFPSLAEGWGLPVAEATVLGTRVLASEHVPAANTEQRLPLNTDTWARTMVNDPPEQRPRDTLDFIDAGRQLFNALRQAINTKPNKRSTKIIRKAHRATSHRPAEITIGFRGDWYSPSGFGESARLVFEALESVDISPCPVTVPKDSIQRPELWSRSCKTIDHADLWVHCLPPDWFELELPGKHVAIFVWETDRLITDDSRGHDWNWIVRLNQLDEIWVPCKFVATVLRDSCVKTPAYIIPFPVNTQKYSIGPARPPVCELPSGFDPTWTVFLYVGTWDARKRPDILVRSFCRAFKGTDRALLILKSYVTGNPLKDRDILRNWLFECRFGSAHICLIPELLRPEEMLNLYRFATVFVTASRGEAFCLPAVQAMSCGAPVLAHNWSAFEDYVSIPIKFQLVSLPSNIGFPGYTPKQRWAKIEENDLTEKLDWVHHNRAEVAQLRRKARKWVLAHVTPDIISNLLKTRVLWLTGKQ